MASLPFVERVGYMTQTKIPNATLGIQVSVRRGIYGDIPGLVQLRRGA